MSTGSLLTNFSQSNFDTDKYCIRPSINTNNCFFFFSWGRIYNTLFFWESLYTTFPAHSQSNCITGQHKTQGCWTPSYPDTGVPQKSSCLWIRKPWGWVAIRESGLRRLGEGPEMSDPPPAWQEARGGNQRPTSPCQGQGGRWLCWGRGRTGSGEEPECTLFWFCWCSYRSTLRDDFTHFVIYCHAGGLISPAEIQGVVGGDRAQLPLGLQWSWCTLGTASSPHTRGIFQLSTAPSKNFWWPLVYSMPPAPVTN